VTATVVFPVGAVDWLRADVGNGFRAFFDRDLAAFLMEGE
jgi:hypothetical protein